MRVDLAVSNLVEIQADVARVYPVATALIALFFLLFSKSLLRSQRAVRAVGGDGQAE